jgi:integrase
MQRVLIRWLEWWETQGHQRSGDILPLSASTLTRKRRLILEEAGIKRWIQDGTRKTFATAHRETFKCKLLTSAALGHKGTTVLDEHYDSRLMTNDEAARYWQILPPVAEIIREEAA